MNQHFIIEGQLPGYNQLNGGGHWAKRSRIKQQAMGTVILYARLARLRPVAGAVQVTITCYEPNRRRDEDNVISGASKVILDALQHEKILPNDNRRWVKMGLSQVFTDRQRPRVEVEIRGRADNE